MDDIQTTLTRQELSTAATAIYQLIIYCLSNATLCMDRINVKNFHGSLTTVVRAQNDTTKTANITDTIFDRTLV